MSMSEVSAYYFMQSEMEKQKGELIKKLKQNPYVQKLIEKECMDEKAIFQNAYKISRWAETLKPCCGCKGLETCTQATKGYFPHLKYDVFLQDTLMACKYQNEKLKKRKHLENILYNDMNEDMWEVDFQDIRLQDTTNKSSEYLKAFQTSLEHSKNHIGTYLYGSMGVGKTYLACCASNYFARKGDHVGFIVWSDFISQISSRIVSKEFHDKMRLIEYVDFLVIDDIGSEKVTEWNRDELLFNLLNKRTSGKKCTWFTSNLDIPTLQKHFELSQTADEKVKAKRVVERIQAITKEVMVVGADRRLEK